MLLSLSRNRKKARFCEPSGLIPSFQKHELPAEWLSAVTTAGTNPFIQYPGTIMAALLIPHLLFSCSESPCILGQWCASLIYRMQDLECLYPFAWSGPVSGVKQVHPVLVVKKQKSINHRLAILTVFQNDVSLQIAESPFRFSFKSACSLISSFWFGK